MSPFSGIMAHLVTLKDLPSIIAKTSSDWSWLEAVILKEYPDTVNEIVNYSASIGENEFGN
jgi:hypothetical protein